MPLRSQIQLCVSWSRQASLATGGATFRLRYYRQVSRYNGPMPPNSSCRGSWWSHCHNKLAHQNRQAGDPIDSDLLSCHVRMQAWVPNSTTSLPNRNGLVLDIIITYDMIGNNCCVRILVRFLQMSTRWVTWVRTQCHSHTKNIGALHGMKPRDIIIFWDWVLHTTYGVTLSK